MKLFRIGLWSAASAAMAVLLLTTAVGCMADRFIFQPPQGNPAAAQKAELLPVAEKISIAVQHHPAPSEEAFTVLYCHGNAEDLSGLRYRLPQFTAHGYGIAAFDYEGYGASGGTPSEGNVYRDAERVWHYLTGEKKIPAERIVLYGRSLGSGPACYLAERFPAAALVLEAPFTSTFAVAGVAWLPGDRFPNLDRIRRVKCPVLIFHGDRDRVIPQEHGKALYEAAPGRKRLCPVPGAGHNNLTAVAGEAYWQELAEFLNGGSIAK